MQIFVCKHPFLLPGSCSKAGAPKQRLNIGNTDTKLLHSAVRIMKITVVILLAACLQASATGYSQKITLSEKEADLETIFKKIEKSTGYKFLYMSELLRDVKKISISVKDANLEEVLNYCFKDLKHLDYEINGNTVIVRLSAHKNAGEEPRHAETESNDIRGVILDENGAPAQGVNVVVKGTSKGTTTNFRGEFTLKDVSENAILVITFVGYDRQEVSVQSKNYITTQLKVAVGKLDELQVIAYGTKSRRFSTGNVSTIKASDFENQPITNPLLALQGRVAGVFVTPSSGLSNGAVDVRIQGQNSLNYTAGDPLIIVDGVPYPSKLPSTLYGAEDIMLGNSQNASFGSPLAFINPMDIESIDVLKDADATAIYGSRAANGALLITTKKGKAGRTRLDVGFQTGWSKLARKAKLLNRRQYLDMRYEAFRNDGIDISSLSPNSSNYDLTLWDTTRDTDWQEVLLGNTAHYTNANLSVSGGNANAKYLIGGNWNRSDAIYPGSFNNQKGSIHFNINGTSTNQRLSIQLSGSYMHDGNLLPGSDLTSIATGLEPVAPPLYNSDGDINWEPNAQGASTWSNPLANYALPTYKAITSNLISNIMVGYKILPGVEFINSAGYTILQANTLNTVPLAAIKPEYKPFSQRSGIYGNKNLNTWIYEPQITGKRSFGNHQLEGLIGATLQQTRLNAEGVQGTGYTSDLLLESLGSATNVYKLGTVNSLYKYNAIFGRINYTWANKYIINFTARRDGSSRFGSENRFHNFASIAGAWIFSEENWFKKFNSFFSFGKLKMSYGTTGNDQIGDYTYTSVYYPTFNDIPYQGAGGLTSYDINNPYLQWEETRKLNIGLDFGFFDDRILINSNFSRNRSSNQLTSLSLPSIAGVNSIQTNLPALIENKTWEFSVNTINIKKSEFKWTSSINLTIGRNKLVSYPGLESSVNANLLVIGQPLSIQRTPPFLGVDPATGLYVIGDKNKEPIPSGQYPTYPDDYTILINTQPKWYGGFQNSITFKGVELSVLLQFTKQIGNNNIYYAGRFGNPGYFFGGNSNQPTTVLDRWQKPGDQKSIQKFSTGFLSPYVAEGAYADATYLRLKNLSLAWQLSNSFLKSIHLQSARFYLQAQNILTITSYKGWDPETQSLTALPPLKVITVGVQVGL